MQDNVGHFLVAQELHTSGYVLCGDKEFAGNGFFAAVKNEYDDDDYDDDDDYVDQDNFEDDDENPKENEKQNTALKIEKIYAASSEDYYSLITVLVSGYVAERILIGKTYSDCENDFDSIHCALNSMSNYCMLGYDNYLYSNMSDYPDEYVVSIMDITQSDIDYAGRLLHIPGTKTKTSDRYIPLFSMLKNLLDGNTKEHPFRIAKINYKILKLRQSCGLTEEQQKIVTPKNFRHTFASQAQAAGVPIKTIQRWLGHSNQKTTTKVYVHETEEQMRKLYDNLYDTFSPQTTSDD